MWRNHKSRLDCSSPPLICYDCTAHIPFASASGAESPSRLSITAFISLTGPYLILCRLPPAFSCDSPVFFFLSLALFKPRRFQSCSRSHATSLVEISRTEISVYQPCLSLSVSLCLSFPLCASGSLCPSLTSSLSLSLSLWISSSFPLSSTLSHLCPDQLR